MRSLLFFRVLTMQIVNLSERPMFVKTIAGWFYDEWGYLRPNNSLDSAVEKIKKRLKGKTFHQSLSRNSMKKQSVPLALLNMTWRYDLNFPYGWPRCMYARISGDKVSEAG
jgi:hypothetical protein